MEEANQKAILSSSEPSCPPDLPLSSFSRIYASDQTFVTGFALHPFPTNAGFKVYCHILVQGMDAVSRHEHNSSEIPERPLGMERLVTCFLGWSLRGRQVRRRGLSVQCERMDVGSHFKSCWMDPSQFPAKVMVSGALYLYALVTHKVE